MAEREVRGGLSAGLRGWGGGLERVAAVLYVLQHRTPAPEPGPADAGGGALRVSLGGYLGMDRWVIAPYKRSWSDVLSLPRAQTTTCGARPAPLGEQAGKRTQKERRTWGRDPLADIIQDERNKVVETASWACPSLGVQGPSLMTMGSLRWQGGRTRQRGQAGALVGTPLPSSSRRSPFAAPTRSVLAGHRPDRSPHTACCSSRSRRGET